MSANIGRTITLFWGETGSPPSPVAVAGIREKGISASGEPVDITNGDDSGWRTLLDAAQVNGVELSCSGVLVNVNLRQDWINGASNTGARMKAAIFRYPLEAGEATPGELTGSFYLQDYSETGAHDGEITFEATFMSSGPVTYTPGA